MIKHLLTELGRIRAGRYLDPRLGRANLNVLDSYISTSNQIFSFCISHSVNMFILLSASGAGGTDLSIEAIVGITIGSAAFITLLIILLVWLVRRHFNGKQPSTLDYQSLQKYNSLVS